MIRILLLLSCIIPFLAAVNPGFKIQATQRGLDYAKGVGLTIVNQKVNGLRIPDVSGYKRDRDARDIFTYQLTSITVASFNAPVAQSTIGLNPGQGITWTSKGISAEVTADYEVKIGSGWFSVSKSGGVTATTSGAQFSISAAFSTSGGKPTIASTGCSADLGDLDVSFSGDLIDDIINLFSDDVASYVKDQLNGIICSQVVQVINTEANGELAGIPTTVNVIDSFDIDYSMTQAPEITASWLALDCKGEVYYESHHDDPGLPVAQPFALGASPAMACFVGDAEYVLGTFGYSAQLSGILKHTLTKDDLGSVGAGGYLACSCSNAQCIGALIPPIGQACAGGTVEIQMASTAAPTAHVNASGAFIAFAGNLNFVARMADNSVRQLFNADITLSTVIPNDVQFINWAIKGEIHVTGAYLTLKASNVPGITGASLEQIWQFAMLTAIDGLLDQMIANGIALPNIPYVNILNPTLSFGERTLTICGDVQFTGL